MDNVNIFVVGAASGAVGELNGWAGIFKHVVVLTKLAVLQGLEKLFGDYIPDDTVLERSEFLLPLDDNTKRLYWNALHPDKTV
jgi:hypothetical protein